MLTGVGAENRGRFLLPVVKPVHFRPLRPGIVDSTTEWGLRQDLELHQAAATMPHRSAHAIRARVATANNDYVEVGGRDVLPVGLSTIQEALGVRAQKVHRKVNALKLTPFDW